MGLVLLTAEPGTATALRTVVVGLVGRFTPLAEEAAAIVLGFMRNRLAEVERVALLLLTVVAEEGFTIDFVTSASAEISS